MKPGTYTVVALFLLVGFSSAAEFFQQAPTVRKPMPERQLFLAFFRSITPPELAGQESKIPLRARAIRLLQYQSSAQLSDDQVRIILDTAVACVTKVAEFDDTARPIILAARERAKISGGVPQPPPVLAELQKQRDDYIDQVLVRLRQSIGDAAFDRLSYRLSHQNVNERGEDRASFSVEVPRELALPAPPESRIDRTDFKVPRESLYESRLPVKIMITPVGPDGTTEKAWYRVGEDVFLKITLLNTVARPEVLHVSEVLRNYELSGTKDGIRLPSPSVWVSLTLVPSLADSPTINIPYNTPLVIGSLRIEKTGPVDLGHGSYTFVFGRQFALRPTISEEEEALYTEIGHFALKSNTISITILP